MDFIKIENDGQKIIGTNYWNTPNARAGYAYMSLNAGAYRLLLPQSRSEWIKEMATAREVVITRGPWMAQAKIDAFEIMFDDGSKSPFVIDMVPEQWDRTPSDADRGWKGLLHVYTDSSPAPTFTFGRVYYRKGNIPCLKKVDE